jgi:hypothetical protein
MQWTRQLIYIPKVTAITNKLSITDNNRLSSHALAPLTVHAHQPILVNTNSVSWTNLTVASF